MQVQMISCLVYRTLKCRYTNVAQQQQIYRTAVPNFIFSGPAGAFNCPIGGGPNSAENVRVRELAAPISMENCY